MIQLFMIQPYTKKEHEKEAFGIYQRRKLKHELHSNDPDYANEIVNWEMAELFLKQKARIEEI